MKRCVCAHARVKMCERVRVREPERVRVHVRVHVRVLVRVCLCICMCVHVCVCVYAFVRAPAHPIRVAGHILQATDCWEVQQLLPPDSQAKVDFS